MSYITDVMLIDIYEKDFDRINEWLMKNDLRHGEGRSQQLRWINMDAAGGGKVFCSKVAAGAFNYLPVGFLDLLKDGSQWISTGMWTYDPESGHRVVGVVGWGEYSGTWESSPVRTVKWQEETD